VSMDDQHAIRRCKEGDVDAFRHLVARYQSAAIGHACAILANGEDARDAAQDAFLSAFRSLARFDEGRKFYPWLYTILKNRCLSVLAERRLRHETAVDEVELIASSPEHSPEELLHLEGALRRLGPDEREIIMLRHFDGLSYAELAELLGLPAGTVMSRLFNARRKLRAELENARGGARKDRDDE
jgi:RNA polymerase sigma-70 factor (ECF subfamily)